jgi:hypothetical protein
VDQDRRSESEDMEKLRVKNITSISQSGKNESRFGGPGKRPASRSIGVTDHNWSQSNYIEKSFREAYDSINLLFIDEQELCENFFNPFLLRGNASCRDATL